MAGNFFPLYYKSSRILEMSTYLSSLGIPISLIRRSNDALVSAINADSALSATAAASCNFLCSSVNLRNLDSLSSSANCCYCLSVMSRAILAAPTILPAVSLIGEEVTEIPI